jgi:hypothetical protein
MSKQTDLINIPDAITVSGSNVGIGTSSPSNYNSGSNNLVVGASSGDNGITIATGTTNGGLLAFADGTTGNSAYRGYIQYDHNSDFLAVGSAGTEAMRIDSSGSVGIGDDTFAAGKLRVYDTAGNHVWLKGRVSDGNASVSFRNNADSAYNGRIATDDTSMNFQVNGAERMRIDGSGNVLVGTTDINPFDNTTGSGIALRSSGAIYNAINNGTPLSLNRMGSDGTIAQFRKDGSTTGQINTRSGQLSIGVSDTGLEFNEANDNVLPCSLTANGGRDAAIDLGSAGARFKDAYLSGGVYLGGTGSANKLDDYEEGTWTPAVSSGTIVISTGSAEYIKVGNVVTCWCRIKNFSDTSSSTHFRLESLPFNKQIGDSNIGYAWGNGMGAYRAFYFYDGSGSNNSNAYGGSASVAGYGPIYHTTFSVDTEMIIKLQYKTP